jgi:hypothetical protein
MTGKRRSLTTENFRNAPDYITHAVNIAAAAQHRLMRVVCAFSGALNQLLDLGRRQYAIHDRETFALERFTPRSGHHQGSSSAANVRHARHRTLEQRHPVRARSAGSSSQSAFGASRNEPATLESFSRVRHSPLTIEDPGAPGVTAHHSPSKIPARRDSPITTNQ